MPPISFFSFVFYVGMSAECCFGRGGDYCWAGSRS